MQQDQSNQTNNDQNLIAGGDPLGNAIRTIMLTNFWKGALNKFSMPTLHGLNTDSTENQPNAQAQQKFAQNNVGKLDPKLQPQSTGHPIDDFMNNIQKTGDRISVRIQDLAHPLLALIGGAQEDIQNDAVSTQQPKQVADASSDADKLKQADDLKQQRQDEELGGSFFRNLKTPDKTIPLQENR